MSKHGKNTYHSYLEPVITLQKRALRIMTLSACTAHSAPLFKQLDIMPFLHARDYKIACVTQNKLSNNLLSSIFITPLRNIRTLSGNNLNLPMVHNCYGIQTVQYIRAQIWNIMSLDIKQSQNFPSSFKKYVQCNDLRSLI